MGVFGSRRPPAAPRTPLAGSVALASSMGTDSQPPATVLDLFHGFWGVPGRYVGYLGYLGYPPTRRVKGTGFPCICPFSCLPMFFYPVLYPGVLGEGAGGGGPPVYLAPGGVAFRPGSAPGGASRRLRRLPEACRKLPEGPGASSEAARSPRRLPRSSVGHPLARPMCSKYNKYYVQLTCRPLPNSGCWGPFWLPLWTHFGILLAILAICGLNRSPEL